MYKDIGPIQCFPCVFRESQTVLMCFYVED